MQLLPAEQHNAHLTLACTPCFNRTRACGRPPALAAARCRLAGAPHPRGGEQRLAFSVLWEMTAEAEILSTNFTKSVIQSRAALTYQAAQERIDDEALQVRRLAGCGAPRGG